MPTATLFLFHGALGSLSPEYASLIWRGLVFSAGGTFAGHTGEVNEGENSTLLVNRDVNKLVRRIALSAQGY